MHLAIDPGKHDFSFALFNGKELIKCGFVEFSSVDELISEVENLQSQNFDIEDLVMETQQVYAGGRGRGNPNDLIPLAFTNGVLAGIVVKKTGAKPHLIHPRTWTNGVKKEIRQNSFKPDKATQDVLTATLKGVAAAKRHNVVDAVMLGLWFADHGPVAGMPTKPKLRREKNGKKRVSRKSPDAVGAEKKAKRNRSKKDGNVLTAQGIEVEDTGVVRERRRSVKSGRKEPKKSTGGTLGFTLTRSSQRLD